MKRRITFILPVACLCAATFLLAQEPAQNEAEKVKELTLAGLKENYFVIFRKTP